MRLFNENENIIEELKEQIEKLCVSDIEGKLKRDEIKNCSYTDKIYDGHNQVLRLKRRILVINEKIIMKEDKLKSRFFNMGNINTSPCGIAYMDMLLNKQKYLVQLFYDEIYEKYREQPSKIMCLGMIPNTNARFLKVDCLDEAEKKKAMLLDEYLILCLIQEQLELLIDYIKCIQFNYLEKAEGSPR